MLYFKNGTCRHGDRCSRLHSKPSISPLLFSNMYQRLGYVTPDVDPWGQPLDTRIKFRIILSFFLPYFNFYICLDVDVCLICEFWFWDTLKVLLMQFVLELLR
ncbi:putative transcription factor C3H family [Helianthus annuus]|uniref:Transcription factor C3H family n=1 Tax=Helianthus annuus TaxID=4232 RepID=A0A9K3I8A8_HELAN|nr:putative transcription factor C3H family [Helianthus annuus]KAJ0527259.1 putative transcription factor C3H family [Helianthus annuus]KAJ0543662.1 putative transcription factor C3H family [Helianthus annuus]KAJ0708717.1 putative transcription factor C3H family [Helianthus annuus]KAJ0712632.1 putative transcription factor C3H family [Helianthus annuus]